MANKPDIVDEFMRGYDRANKEGLAWEFVDAFLQSVETHMESHTIRLAISDALWDWDL